MEFANEFSLGVPVDRAWAVLIDLEHIAPCIPGAEVQEVEGEHFHGVLRLKVGPLKASYRGVASIQERDEANHRTVVRFDARDTRGQGTASGTVTATLEPANDGTHVSVHTELKISGKLAQFGRGVLADVSKKLLRQFVEALEVGMLAHAAVGGIAAREASAQGEPGPASDPRRIAKSDQAVGLLAVAGPSVIKRIVPVILAVAALLWLLRRG